MNIKNLGDYFNDFKHNIESVDLPKLKTDVEVKPSASFIYLILGVVAVIAIVFGKK